MAKRRRQLISRAARVAIDDATIDELPAPWRRIGTVPRRFWIAHRPGIQDPPCPYIFIERQAFSKGPRGSWQCRPCPTPLSQPIIVRSLSLALVIIRRVVLPRTCFLPSISFVKISLKFHLIGDELLSFLFSSFFFATLKLQATFYSEGRSIGLAWIICLPVPERRLFAQRRVPMCFFFSFFFRFIVIADHYRGPQAW